MSEKLEQISKANIKLSYKNTNVIPLLIYTLWSLEMKDTVLDIVQLRAEHLVRQRINDIMRHVESIL